MNDALHALPKTVPHPTCLDARDLNNYIGNQVHFDTAAQNEIGRRLAATLIEPTNP